MTQWQRWKSGMTHRMTPECQCEFCQSDLGRAFHESEQIGDTQPELLIDPNELRFYLFWPEEDFKIEIEMELAHALASTFADALLQFSNLYEEATVDGGVN